MPTARHQILVLYQYKRHLALAFILLAFLADYEGHRRTRFYLTRNELPDPRSETAWAYLWRSYQDRAFITTMGFDSAGIQTLLEGGFRNAWNTIPIPRGDVDGTSYQTRGSRRSLNAEGALGLVLHHLNSTMPEKTLQQVFGLTPAVCSRYLNFALRLLLDCLRTMHIARIKWPIRQERNYFKRLIFRRHPRLKGAFGFVDGLHLPVARSADLDVENAYYNGWCADHFTSNLFTFAPDGTIIQCTINAPGSWHDSAVAAHLYEKLYFRTPRGSFLIADTAFPHNSPRLQGKIRTPPKSDFTGYSNNIMEAREQVKFNEELVSARQAAEWGMECLQGSFSRLKLPMPAENDKYRFMVLEVCARLHNVRTRVVGINQIKTVYEDVWASGGVYREFHDMLFTDIKKNDRIRRFYNFAP